MCSTTLAVPTYQVHYIRMFITHRAYHVFSVSIPIHKIQLREFMGATIPVMKPLGYHFVTRMHAWSRQPLGKRTIVQLQKSFLLLQLLLCTNILDGRGHDVMLFTAWRVLAL